MPAPLRAPPCKRFQMISPPQVHDDIVCTGLVTESKISMTKRREEREKDKEKSPTIIEIYIPEVWGGVLCYLPNGKTF